MQSDHARLDTLLITLANLFRIFSNDHTLNLDVRRAVLRSLEGRWAKQDQDVIILACILNPFIRGDIFSPRSPFHCPNKIIEIASTAYRRFCRQEPNMEFQKAVQEYMNRHGRWSHQQMGLAMYDPSPNPVQ